MNRDRPPRSIVSRWALVAALFGLMLLPPHLRVTAMLAVTVLTIGAGAARGQWRRRARVAGLERPGEIVLGTGAEDGELVTLSDRQMSAHGLILGASGAGKTTTLLSILTANVRRGLPVIAIDLKGSPSFAHQLADAAAGSGRRLRVWSPDGPDHWNPLQHGNATELKDKLIATERFTEPHYQRAAERYVQTALKVLIAADPGRPPTLDRVVGLMEPARLATLTRRVPGELAEATNDYLETLTRDQLSAIRGLGTRLAIISESHVGPYLMPSDSGAIDLHSALAGDEVILFSLNSSRYSSLSSQIGTIAIQDLVSAVGHRLTEPGRHQAVIGIDEFSALGADHVLGLLARGRESGVSVILATQELADLDRAARGLRDQVLGNTAFKIAHRQDVPGSAAMIAEMAGTERVWEPTYRIGPGPLGGHDRSRGSRRQVEQFLVHPNEVKRLRTGEGIVITKTPEARARKVQVRPPGRGEAERGL